MADLVLNALATAEIDSSFDQVRKMMKEFDKTKTVKFAGDFNKLEQSSQKVFNDLAKQINDSTAQAISLGLDQGFFGVKKYAGAMAKISEGLLEKQTEIGALQSQLSKEEDAREQKRLQKKIKALEEEERDLVKRYKKELKLSDYTVKKRSAAIEELDKKQEKSLRQRSDEMLDSAVAFVDKISSVQGLSLEGLAKGVGGGIQKSLKNLEKLGMQKAARGTSGFGRELGALIAKMGPVIATVGALAGGLAAAVKMIIDADAQTKELNRSLLTQVSVANLMVGRAENLKGALEAVRDAAVSWRNNMKWGTTAQEQIQILNAFNEAGFTFREMANQLEKGKKSMYAYQKATETALTYSKLLGLSAQEIATNMGDFMDDFGAGLGKIRDRFAAIYDAASLSGFSAKRFYGIVLEATSGMSLYNVRLEESAGLLLKLGKILGKKVAPEFLNSITNMFKGDDMQTRMKKILLARPKNVASIFKKSAENVSAAFLNDFGDKFGKLAMHIPGLKDIDPKKGAAAFAQALSKLDPKVQAKAIAELGTKNAGMAKRLENLVEVSKGMKGGLTNMATNLDSLDLGGKLQFAMTQSSAIFKQPIHDLKGVNLAAFSNMTGMGMEQIKQLQRVSKRLTGNYGVLKDQAARLNELRSLNKEDSKEYKRLVEQQKKNAETMGAIAKIGKDGNYQVVAATLKNGKIVADKNKDVLKTQQDYIQSSGKVLSQAAKKGAPEHIQLARETAKQTTDMTHVLKTGVQFWLEQINKAVQYIANWLPGGLDDTEKKNKQALIDQTQRQIKETKTRQEETSKNLTSLRQQAKRQSGAQKEKTQQQIKQLEKLEGALNFQLTRQVKTLDKLRDIREGKGTLVSYSKRELLAQAQGGAAIGLVSSMGLSKKLEERVQARAAKESQKMTGTHVAGGITFTTGYRKKKGPLTKEELAKIRKEEAEKMVEEQNAQNQRIINSNKEENKKSEDKADKRMDPQAKKIADENEKAKRRSKIQEIMQALGPGRGGMSRADVNAYVQLGKITDNMKTILSRKTGAKTLGGGEETFGDKFGIALVKAASNAVKTQDFLLSVTEGGKISVLNRFSPADNISVVGAKAGGEIDTAAAAGRRPGEKGRGAAGVRPIVNITINGNEEKAYAVVRKALKTAGVT